MSTLEIWGALLILLLIAFCCLAAALWEMCQGMPMEDDE